MSSLNAARWALTVIRELWDCCSLLNTRVALFSMQVDAEGPLVRLKNLLFNQRTLLTIAQWVTVSGSCMSVLLCTETE